MSEKEKILRELEPLFIKAKSEGLWFYSNYQDMWFSPDDLKEEQSQGYFIWGTVNWKLRSPIERLQELERYKDGAIREYNSFKAKLGL